MMTLRGALFDAGIDFDPGDRWGSALGAWFGIAEALVHAKQEIPDAWAFRHSPTCRDLDAEEDYAAVGITAEVRNGYLTWDDVTRMGNVLQRYTSILERAGESY